MKTLLYVIKSTSGEYVGRTYEVDIAGPLPMVEDGAASFRPSQIEVLPSGKIRAYNEHFAVICNVVGTKA